MSETAHCAQADSSFYKGGVCLHYELHRQCGLVLICQAGIGNLGALAEVHRIAKQLLLLQDSQAAPALLLGKPSSSCFSSRVTSNVQTCC